MEMQSNKIDIQKKLCKLLLEKDKPFVAMLSGEWGIGKTYFWNEFITKYTCEEYIEEKGEFMRGNYEASKIISIRKKHIVYISLFGKNTLDDIQSDIISQISQWTKGIQVVNKKLNNFQSTFKGEDFNIPLPISSIVSLFEKQNFKNIIICFDDFERLSNKIYLKDLMGLISQFKEQKECKIVMILNEHELDKLSNIEGEKHNEIFALYKEKIVDYNFYYQPSNKELFKIVEEDIKAINCSSNTIFEVFKENKLRNIRIMKQCIYQLSHFDFIVGKYDKAIIKEFTVVALNLFILKAKSNFNYLQFISLQEYIDNLNTLDITPENPDNPNFARNKIYDIYIYFNSETNQYIDKFLYTFRYYDFKESIEKILKIIYTFMDKYSLDKEELIELLNKEEVDNIE